MCCVDEATTEIYTYGHTLSLRDALPSEVRVLLVWNRLIFPNGRSIVLERQPGADAEGFAGLQDGVDYHWRDLAKAAGLSTLLSVGAALATNDDDRLLSAIRNGGQDTTRQEERSVGEGGGRKSRSRVSPN